MIRLESEATRLVEAHLSSAVVDARLEVVSRLGSRTLGRFVPDAGTIKWDATQRRGTIDVDAVIDMPANLFFGTSIATTILVLRKNKKNDNGVLFISGSDEFVKEGNKNKLTDANIDAIFKLYTDRKTVKYKTRLVPYEEIAKNGFNLSVATYVDTTPPAPPKDLKAIAARVVAATKETDKCRAAVDKILKELI